MNEDYFVNELGDLISEIYVSSNPDKIYSMVKDQTVRDIVVTGVSLDGLRGKDFLEKIKGINQSNIVICFSTLECDDDRYDFYVQKKPHREKIMLDAIKESLKVSYVPKTYINQKQQGFFQGAKDSTLINKIISFFKKDRE